MQVSQRMSFEPIKKWRRCSFRTHRIRIHLVRIHRFAYASSRSSSNRSGMILITSNRSVRIHQMGIPSARSYPCYSTVSYPSSPEHFESITISMPYFELIGFVPMHGFVSIVFDSIRFESMNNHSFVSTKSTSLDDVSSNDANEAKIMDAKRSTRRKNRIDARSARHVTKEPRDRSSRREWILTNGFK